MTTNGKHGQILNIHTFTDRLTDFIVRGTTTRNHSHNETIRSGLRILLTRNSKRENRRRRDERDGFGNSLTGIDKARMMTGNDTGRIRDGFGDSLTETDKASMTT